MDQFLKNKNKKAFTLAEVLITLGIIGVVAAMTTPIVVKITNDIQYKTAYKKAYSDLTQVVSNANNEGLFIPASSAEPRPGDFDKNFLAIMSKFKTSKQCISGNDAYDCWDENGERYRATSATPFPRSSEYAFVDNSGRAWVQYWNGCNSVMVDTNGFKKPNQMGKDRFYFIINDKNGQNEYNTDVPIKVLPRNDNEGSICNGNKCQTSQDYFGRSWLFKQ